MFVKSTEIVYLSAEEYTELYNAYNVANHISSAVHDETLGQLAANAVGALAALTSSSRVQVGEQEEEE